MNGAALATVRRPAAHGVVLLVAGFAFFAQWQALVALWQSSFVYGHGWLIAGVAGWLLLTAPGPATRARPAPGLALLPLVVAVLALVLATHARLDLAQEALLPVLALAYAYSVYGWPGVRHYAFPAGYFLFAIPLWDVLIPTLQWLTVQANAVALGVLGVPAHIQGDLVTVPAGVFEIAGGCSGSHFFVVALAVSSLEAYFTRGGVRRSLTSIVLALSLALAANWVRVLVIILRGNATHMQTSLIKDHYWFGWFLFAGALGLYFLLLRAFDERHPVAPRATLPAVRAATSWATLAPGLVLFVLLGAHAAVWHAAWARTPVALPPAPTLANEFYGPVLKDVAWHPVFPGAAAEGLATYHGSDGPAAFYRAAFGEQHSGAKLIGYGDSWVPEGWRVISARRSTPGNYTDFPPVTVLEAQAPDGTPWLVWAWYRVGGRRTAHPAVARGWLALEGLGWLTPVPAEAAALAAPCDFDCVSARERLGRLARRLNAGDR